LSEVFFDEVAGGADAVFFAEDSGDFGGALRVGGILEELCELCGGAFGSVVVAGEGAGDAEAGDAVGVVGLVESEGDDEHGAACVQGLAGGAYAALVDDGGGARKQCGEGGVLEGGDAIGEFSRVEVARVAADEEDGAAVEELSGLDAVPVERAGIHDCGGAEGEDEGRVACVEECGEVGREGDVAVVLIVKGKASGGGVRRPVFLRGAEHGGEEGEGEFR